MKYLPKFFLLAAFSLVGVAAHSQPPSNAEDVEPIEVGVKVPSGDLMDLAGDAVLFNRKFASKSVVVFYRGGWCPYCNVHLAELQEVLEAIKEEGYTLIAISPDSPDNLRNSIQKNELAYQLYSDPGLSLAMDFGIVFKAPERYIQMLEENSGGRNPGFLPVPAVFVINKKGKVSFAYVNADYKTRLSGEAILEAIKD